MHSEDWNYSVYSADVIEYCKSAQSACENKGHDSNGFEIYVKGDECIVRDGIVGDIQQT